MKHYLIYLEPCGVRPIPVRAGSARQAWRKVDPWQATGGLAFDQISQRTPRPCVLRVDRKTWARRTEERRKRQEAKP